MKVKIFISLFKVECGKVRRHIQPEGSHHVRHGPFQSHDFPIVLLMRDLQVDSDFEY